MQPATIFQFRLANQATKATNDQDDRPGRARHEAFGPDEEDIAAAEEALDHVAIGAGEGAKAFVDRLFQVAQRIVIHVRKFGEPIHAGSPIR